MTIIYHNPKCSTSRNVLAAIRASGTEPEVVEYLTAGWTRPQLQLLFTAAGLSPREALRTKAPEAASLRDADDSAILEAMVHDPILVERPFVASALGVRLCRPVETVLDLLSSPLPEGFTKEDGKPLAPRKLAGKETA